MAHYGILELCDTTYHNGDTVNGKAWRIALSKSYKLLDVLEIVKELITQIEEADEEPAEAMIQFVIDESGEAWIDNCGERIPLSEKQQEAEE